MAAERHATRTDTVPDPEGGGHWVALCLTCGWEKEGHYVLTEAEPVAFCLANLQSDLHETTELVREAGGHG